MLVIFATTQRPMKTICGSEMGHVDMTMVPLWNREKNSCPTWVPVSTFSHFTMGPETGRLYNPWGLRSQQDYAPRNQVDASYQNELVVVHYLKMWFYKSEPAKEFSQ